MPQHPWRHLWLAFRLVQELLCQLLRRLSLPAVEVKQAQPSEYREELRRVPGLLT
jgi:hypothetical protein